MSSKTNELTLQQKNEVLLRIEKKIPYRAIAAEFKCSTGVISTIKKNKRLIEDSLLANEPPTKKRLLEKKTANHDINILMYKWFLEVRSRNIPLSGPTIRQKALKYADALGIVDFGASDGWLTRFKERYNIKFKEICDGLSSVDKNIVNNWKVNLINVCAGYRDEDIFNADESGLNWRCLPNKTFALAGEATHGIKNSKERITLLLAASRTGEKLKPLVIAKSANPRCFKNIKKENLPVTYRSNSSAWMVTDLF